MENENNSVSMRDYVDARFDDLKEMLSTIDRLNAKAIDQYSKTTDEWKALHNDLQRKLQDDRNMYVTKEAAEKQSKANFQKVTVVSTQRELDAITDDAFMAQLCAPENRVFVIVPFDSEDGGTAMELHAKLPIFETALFVFRLNQRF